MFFDFIPLILFFLAFQSAQYFPLEAENFLHFLGLSHVLSEQTPILIATFTLIVSTLLQIFYLFFTKKKISKMLLISFLLLVLFGVLTLIFQNSAFIKTKPSILYLLFSFVFLISIVLKKNPLKHLLGQQMELPVAIWQKLNWAWFGFFMVMALLNAVVAFCFSTAFWVNFKLFGALGLTFLFVMIQGIFLAKYLK